MWKRSDRHRRRVLFFFFFYNVEEAMDGVQSTPLMQALSARATSSQVPANDG